ncbi:hypothetical protein Tco_1158656 [Tanacetum coccineum]
MTKLNKKTREKVVPYTRFLSLLLEHNMKGYGNDNVTLIPTQVFSVHNWALKKNQPKGPPFIDHVLAICKSDVRVEHKSPIASSYTRKKDSKGKKPRAKFGHKKQSTSSKHHPLSKIEATKVAGLYKEDQQATSGPTSLGVTSKEGSNPQLSSDMLTFTHNKPIYLISTIIHSKCASGCDASTYSTAKADPGIFAPDDSVPQQQGMDDLNVLGDKSKSVSEGLETVLNKPTTGKGASYIEQKLRKISTLLLISPA